MLMKFFMISLLSLLIACNNKNNIDSPTKEDNEMYFPDNNSVWSSKSIEELNWNSNALTPLKDYLIANNSKSFMILVDGKIVVEEYFNNHHKDSTWQWNSSGKTLVTATTNIAQQNGLIDVNSKVSSYLGNGWTSEPIEKENLITSKHLLSMTSGINDEKQLVIKKNLTYLADAGTRWSYHNVFQKLMDVVAQASNQEFESYFNIHLKNKIGMTGYWNNGIIFKIYHSNTRSMARFGLLALNKGYWKNEQIIDSNLFEESITSSQNINPSYGYLWWLNGKESYMLPGSQTVYNTSIIPNAPTDMYAALGAQEQRIYVIPSKNMVIIRMGEAANDSNSEFALSSFDNELWEKINDLIN